jgi:DNA polymerase III gamma/tau subunit
VDEKTIQQLLGLPPAEALQTLLHSVNGGDPAKLVRDLTELYNQGFQAATIAKQLGQLLRADIVKQHPSSNHAQNLELLGKLVEVPPAYDPERYLEIILLQTASAAQPALRPKAQPAETIAEELPPPPAPTLPAKSAPLPATNQSISNEELWPAVLLALKQKHNTLYGIVRMAKPSFAAKDTLQLTFAFAFHQKRLNQAVNRQLLMDTIEVLAGRSLNIEYLLDTNGTPAQQATPNTSVPADDSLSTISNIFSGAELLES